MSGKNEIIDWAEGLEFDMEDFDDFDDYYEAVLDEWEGRLDMETVLGDELDDFKSELEDYFNDNQSESFDSFEDDTPLTEIETIENRFAQPDE